MFKLVTFIILFITSFVISAAPNNINVRAKLDDKGDFYDLSKIRPYIWGASVLSGSEVLHLTLNGDVYNFPVASLLSEAFSLWSDAAHQEGISQNIGISFQSSNPIFNFSLINGSSSPTGPYGLTQFIADDQHNMNEVWLYSANIQAYINNIYMQYRDNGTISSTDTIHDFASMFIRELVLHEVGHLFSLSHPNSSFGDRGLRAASNIIIGTNFSRQPTIMTGSTEEYFSELRSYLRHPVSLSDITPSSNDGLAVRRLYRSQTIPPSIQPAGEVISTMDFCYDFRNINCSQIHNAHGSRM